MTPYINPLGFIDKRTPRGVRFLLTNPDDSRTLKVGTPRDHLATIQRRTRPR